MSSMYYNSGVGAVYIFVCIKYTLQVKKLVFLNKFLCFLNSLKVTIYCGPLMSTQINKPFLCKGCLAFMYKK